VRLLVIFNPNAAGGRAEQLLPRIRAALAELAELELRQTRSGEEARRIAAASDLRGFDALIAAGGDGTLFEVLNGLYARPPAERPPLGIVPVGTGNAFARELGLLPGQWRQAVAIIGRGRSRAIDVGRVRGDGQSFHFLNIVGAGLPVDAMRTAEHLRLAGRAAYSLAALWRALRRRTYPLQIEIDGDRISEESLFVEISNTRYTGTSFLMAPDAVMDDGLLDVTLVRTLSRPRLLRLFPTVYSGRHVRYPEVITRRAREIRILSPHRLPLAADGEICGQTPVTVDCLKRDLQLLC
jgi:diacylglycerol kinase (ATP)